MARLNLPGAALALVEGDEITHRRTFGKAHPGGEAPTAQTPFFIGSLTKSFTALAVMQLVEAGKLDLDAPVQRYLPWFTRPRNPVIGNILAGEVEVSGKDISRFRAGDQVDAFTILSQTGDRLTYVEQHPCYLRHLHRLNRRRG